MKLFVRYLRQNLRLYAALAAFCLIFAVSFALYHLPLKAVAYPTLLCLLLAIVLSLLDFRRKKRRHEELAAVRGITEAAQAALPCAESIEDEDYQRIIKLIAQEHALFCTEEKRRYIDMSDYYTTWVHQIKTPIASMRLRLQNEDSQLSRRLSSELMRIEQYVEMVLTFLRLDSDSSDLVIQEHELDAIVKPALRKFAGEFIDRRLELKYEPLEVKVLSDEKWLSFVIEQLISNALKYTPSGCISIYLEPEKKLCIRDTGIGIAPEDLPRVFENGYTGYNGRSDKRASGIGLYLCKRICTKLGHGIKAESTVGEGTVMTLDLEQKKLNVE